MKITELLAEAKKANISSYLSAQSDFQQIGNYYVFIWTNNQLKELLKVGVRSSTDLQTVRTPGSAGIGIVDGRTGHICVGAIDHDYEALWASSTDVSDFFVASRNRKLMQLPNRLQNLADLLAELSEQSKDDFKSDNSGVDAIVDTIKNDDDFDDSPIDTQKISGMKSVSDVKNYLTSELKAVLRKLDKDRVKNLSYEELSDAIQLRKDIEHLLKKKSHLFVDSDDTDDDDTEDSGDLESKIDAWTRHFQRDFPNLNLDSAQMLDPNN